MRVFRAQGGAEAIDRQYKLYRDSLRHFDDRRKAPGCVRSIASWRTEAYVRGPH
jgi:hypothetical protein